MKQKQHEDSLAMNNMKLDITSIYTTVKVINSSVAGLRANAPPGDIAQSIERISSDITKLNSSLDYIMKMANDELAREAQKGLSPSTPDFDNASINRRQQYCDVVTTGQKSSAPGASSLPENRPTVSQSLVLNGTNDDTSTNLLNTSAATQSTNNDKYTVPKSTSSIETACKNPKSGCPVERKNITPISLPGGATVESSIVDLTKSRDSMAVPCTNTDSVNQQNETNDREGRKSTSDRSARSAVEATKNRDPVLAAIGQYHSPRVFLRFMKKSFWIEFYNSYTMRKLNIHVHSNRGFRKILAA